MNSIRPEKNADQLLVGGPGVAWRQTAGEIVVLDLAGSVYFGLNGTAASLWRRLTLVATRAELIDQLRVQGADDARATHDVDEFLAQLDQYGLLGREPRTSSD